MKGNQRTLLYPLSLHQPARYQIEIQGRLDPSWSAHFNDMTITVKGDSHGLTITTLSGLVADQSALHGMLNHIRDLGLPLLTVRYLGPARPDPVEDI